MRRRLLCGVACVLLSGALPAHAAAPAPADTVLATIAAVRQSLAALRAQGEPEPQKVIATVRDVVLPRVDTELAARLVLGRHWQAATAAQRQAFIEAERELMLRLYASHALDYLDAEVDVLSTQLATDGQRCTVRTRVRRTGHPELRVDYQLRLATDEWKVFDAVVNGVSAVITLRNATGEDITRYGLDGTIARLHEKLDAAPASAAAR